MQVPNSGALFVFGGNTISENQTCFWLKADVTTSVSCGDEHTALLTEKGKVYVFGSNNWGQLGLGHTQAINKPTCIRSLSNECVAMIACGRNHTLAASKDNRLFGFGNNSDSQLGFTSMTSCEYPKQISGLPSGKIQKIAAGADFSVLLLENGDVYAWGCNSDGQLGLVNVNECAVPTRLDVSENIIDIACGYYHTAMVSSSHKLYTFGENEFGKLGVRKSPKGSLPSMVILPSSITVGQVACGGSQTAFISTDHKLFTFGGGYRGELGQGEDVLQSDEPRWVDCFKDKKIRQVYCGESFSCCVTEDGMLYSFGDGRKGKLGLSTEDFSNQFFPAVCETVRQYSVKFAACGGCHMIAFVVSRENHALSSTNLEHTKYEKAVSSLGELNLSQSQTDLPDVPNIELRSSFAREKRRKNRSTLAAATVSPVNTLDSLNSQELIEAVKSFPKMGFSNDVTVVADTNGTVKANQDQKLSCDASDISTLNKVHKVIQANGETVFVPVIRPHSDEDHSHDDNYSSNENEDQLHHDEYSEHNGGSGSNIADENLSGVAPAAAQQTHDIVTSTESENKDVVKPDEDTAGEISKPETSPENAGAEASDANGDIGAESKAEQDPGNTSGSQKKVPTKSTPTKKSKLCVIL